MPNFRNKPFGCEVAQPTGAKLGPIMNRQHPDAAAAYHHWLFITGFAAGSTGDTTAGLMGQWLSQLRQQFVIEYRCTASIGRSER